MSSKNKFLDQVAAILRLKIFLSEISRANPKEAKDLSRKRTKRDFNIIKKWIKGDEVLDYGCGSGEVALMIKSELKKEVILTDVANRNKTPLPFYLCDSRRTPFADNQFDTVIMLNVLHHAGNMGLLIREAARLTRGRIIIFEQHLYKKEESRGLSRQEWKNLVVFEEIILRDGDDDIFKNKFFELYHLWSYDDLIRYFRRYRLKLIFKKFIPPFFKNIFINQGWLFVLNKNAF